LLHNWTKGVPIMLLDKISQTRKTFEEYNKINSKLQQVKRVNSFCQTTKSDFKKIKSTLGSYHALHQMDKAAFSKKDFTYELRQLEVLIQSGLDEYNRDLVSSFWRLFKKLDDDLKTKWTIYVSKKNQDFIGLLGQLQNIVPNPEDIKQLIIELRRFENIWPVTTQSLARYHEQVTNANNVISEINASKGVQEFISKVASNQASLDDLTDEVISWLRTKKLTNKLVIKFK
jgi:hypothetical protein